MWYVMLGSREEGHTLMSTRLGTRYASISSVRDAERANDDHDHDDDDADDDFLHRLSVRRSSMNAFQRFFSSACSSLVLSDVTRL